MIGFSNLPLDDSGDPIPTYPVELQSNAQLLTARMTAVLYATPNQFIDVLRADRAALADYLSQLDEAIDAHEQARRGLN
ncbi:hypothetical protein [Ruegeria atlantica]|uniref:hypothetical protein n=1 Tax=Ruegeria atlantica TaxID=81569 RepID=UPI00147E291B|nr:hypothetical protein [Ruegeria atlantica]